MKDIQWASRLHRCFRLTSATKVQRMGSFIHWNGSPASFHIFTCKQWFLLHLPHTAVLVILLPMVVRVTLLLLLVLAILLMDAPAILLMAVPATRLLLRVPAIRLMAIPVALLLLTEARVIPLLLMAVLAILRLLVVVLATILRLPRALVCLLPLVATGVVTKRYPDCMCLL